MKRGVFYILLFTCCACKKPAEGYLGENIYYKNNPFNVPQGIATYSEPIESDGSTNPLYADLLQIRNKATGEIVDSLFASTQNIPVYKATVTYEDSTVALLNQKLGDSLVKPFNINHTGGRLELTPATNYVDAGTYTIDVNVFNMRGSRTLKNACDIVINPATAFNLTYKAWSTSTPVGEVFTGMDASALVIDVTRQAGPNKIILKFVDKNGTPFSASGGEIIKRGDRPTLSNWDPYFPEVKTDSGYVYEYPVAPEFPVFTQCFIGAASWSGYICYYRIAARYTDINVNINPVFTIKYLLQGTYTVTVHLSNVVRKQA